MVHYVGMDHQQAMRSVLSHLCSQGRTALAHIGARPTNAPSFERRSAYLRYFRGLPDAARVYLGEFSFDCGLKGTKEVLKTWPEVDAIVCGNDLIAFGALQALDELGIVVPDQVAVVGFDDSLYALISRPTLTTVRQPLERMASAALALLFAGKAPQGTYASPGSSLCANPASGCRNEETQSRRRTRQRSDTCSLANCPIMLVGNRLPEGSLLRVQAYGRD